MFQLHVTATPWSSKFSYVASSMRMLTHVVCRFVTAAVICNVRLSSSQGYCYLLLFGALASELARLRAFPLVHIWTLDLR